MLLAGETKKKPSTTVRAFHTCREGSRCFVLPATCPRGCLLFCDLRRSRVWSAHDERTSLEEVCRKRVVCGRTLGSKVGHTVGWVGVELLWAAGLDSQRPWKWALGGFFYLQCNSVQSFTACKPVQSFWSSSSTWRFRQGGALLLQACGDIRSVGLCPTPKTLGEIMDSLNHRISWTVGKGPTRIAEIQALSLHRIPQNHSMSITLLPSA